MRAEETFDLVEQVIEGVARAHNVADPERLVTELRTALRGVGYEITHLYDLQRDYWPRAPTS